MARSKMKIQNDDYERLHAEFERLRGDVMSLARELKTYAEHEERDLGEAASERVVALRAAGERQFEAAKTYAIDAAKTAETTVKEHPVTAVAGAAALGFLVGAIALRRR